MPIGADVSVQYTEEAVGGGHPTKARVIDRLALAEHHMDGKHKAEKLPILCGGYLEKASATSLIFRPVANSNAWLNGLAAFGSACPFRDGSGNLYYLAIPAAGVTIANTGLGPGVLYYVYAYDNAGAVALEISGQAPAVLNQGFPVKTGDTSRTLVGAVFTGSASPGDFVYTDSEKLVSSFWNRRLLKCVSTDVTDRTSGNSTSQIGSMAVSFISWGDEPVLAYLMGHVGQDTDGAYARVSIGEDSASNNTEFARIRRQGANDQKTLTVAYGNVLSLGKHTLYGVYGTPTSAGQATIYGNTETSRLWAFVRG